MSQYPALPLIGIPACRLYDKNGLPIHKVSESYVKGVIDGAGGVPVLLPAIGEHLGIEALDRWLDAVDGILLSGSPSNVDPAHYAGGEARRDSERDPARDATTLPLIRRTIERGVPLLAICRGIQELNVALGGTLHQHVHEVPGRMDHRSDKSRPMVERFRDLAHKITLTEGGMLQDILCGAGDIDVNTLHGQAIDRPGERVTVEALAPDGTIEAVSVKNAPGFVLGLQWHPEWHVLDNPHSRRLFSAFGDACRAHVHAKAMPVRRAS
ncbi:MAG: gamma-glutamyl-gamma-aminobutyrate hydrolase family protein [Alphaproteobacteria bacterium]